MSIKERPSKDGNKDHQPSRTLSPIWEDSKRSNNMFYILRLMQGCCFGGLSVSQSIVNHYLDDTNMALGMAIMTSTGTCGFIIGPALSGVTVFPVEQYPSIFSSSQFLREFPVFLPNAIVAAALVLAMLLVTFFIPEPGSENREYSPLLIEDDGVETYEEDQETDEICGEYQEEHIDSHTVPTEITFWSRVANTNVAKVFATKDCIISCVLYGFLGFSACAFQELFPLLASTSPRHHGLGMTTTEIGLVMLIISAVLLALQVPVLSTITNALGPKKTFCVSALLQAFLLPFMPAVGEISSR